MKKNSVSYGGFKRTMHPSMATLCMDFQPPAQVRNEKKVQLLLFARVMAYIGESLSMILYLDPRQRGCELNIISY